MGIKRTIKNTIHYVSEKSRPHFSKDFSDVDTMYCAPEKTTYIASSNNIIVFENNGIRYYFKECRRHAAAINDYLIDVLNDYFSSVRKDDTEIRDIIFSDLQKKINIDKFSTIFDYSSVHYDIIHQYTGWDTEIIGLPSLYKMMNKNNNVNIWMNNVFPKFIEYIRNEIDAYVINRYIRTGEYQKFRPSLSIATRKMAVLLDINEMVPPTEYINLQVGNLDKKFGIVTKHVEGISPLDIENRRQTVTPKLQQQLNVLHLFDIICFQRDHSLQNYFVMLNTNNLAENVIAYDNDSPQAFYPLPIINFGSCLECSPMIHRGIINRPFIDEQICENILDLNTYSIQTELEGILSDLQILMLCQRTNAMKKAINKTKNRFPQRFISADQWNEDSIKEEISGKYGKTYLMHYINNDEQDIVNKIMNK